MHAAIYQARGDVNAIVHTHQVYASALTLINKPIPALFDEQSRFLVEPLRSSRMVPLVRICLRTRSPGMLRIITMPT